MSRVVLPRLAATFVVASLAAALDGCGGGAQRPSALVGAGSGAPGATPACAVTVTDPSTLVLVHSFTGHSARVGCELAAMLGARFERVGDPPMPGLPAAGATSDATVATLRLDGVRRLYFGFPIWGPSEPSEPAQRMLAKLALAGIEVVPFHTYIHYADPDALAKLGALVRARGGTPLPPLAVEAPFWLPASALDRALHRAFAARPELRAPSAEPAPKVACRAAGAPREGELCAVPAGASWLGDFGGDGAPDGYAPPRLRKIGAFEIDRAEITVGQYARCASAGACEAIRYTDGECGRLVKDDASLPAPCLSFEAAKRFCSWAGMRLPTEAEWIRAARADGATAYPWGDAFARDGDPLRGNFGEKPATGLPRYSIVDSSRAWPADGAPGLAAGCRYEAGRSPFGACDLAGNLAEWVVDEHGAPLLKGGSWLDGDPAAFRVGARGRLSLERDDLGVGMYLTGARCVRSAAGS